tara:strand:+ start:483 stop:698 length:216 start_codon:yes stop_codon:yes gene_type:complete
VGFEIAGADKVFYSAGATFVNRKKIVVKRDKVFNLVQARYPMKIRLKEHFLTLIFCLHLYLGQIIGITLSP